MNDSLIVCENLVKICRTAEREVVALRGLDPRVAAGEMLGIVGASGSGKSTPMNSLGGLDAPTAGACHAPYLRQPARRARRRVLQPV